MNNEAAATPVFNSLHIEKAAQILKAIAHPVRLAVLQCLAKEKSMSVSELQAKTDIGQSLLSHHLIKMKDKGVLFSIREGKNIRYSVADSHILKIFDCLENCSIL